MNVHKNKKGTLIFASETKTRALYNQPRLIVQVALSQFALTFVYSTQKESINLAFLAEIPPLFEVA